MCYKREARIDPLNGMRHIGYGATAKRCNYAPAASQTQRLLALLPVAADRAAAQAGKAFASTGTGTYGLLEAYCLGHPGTGAATRQPFKGQRGERLREQWGQLVDASPGKWCEGVTKERHELTHWMA